MKKKKKKTIYVVDNYKYKKILADKYLPPSAKLLLHYMIRTLGYKYYCFPSQERISKDIAIGAKQIRNLIRMLREKRIIKVKRSAFNPKTGKRVNSNEYDLSEILIKKEVIVKKK